jgi:hypothetical protein
MMACRPKKKTLDTHEKFYKPGSISASKVWIPKIAVPTMLCLCWDLNYLKGFKTPRSPAICSSSRTTPIVKSTIYETHTRHVHGLKELG